MAAIPESHRDLTEQPVASLSTIGPDGRPQVSAVWFLIDGDSVRVSLNTTRQKTKNLQANPAANLFILDPSGYRYLEIRGDATLEPDDDYSFATVLGAKYGGADLRRNDRPGESRLVVTIDPVRVNAVDMTGG
jgi:PPOX class probable F420-dependent enzyme